MSYIMIWAIFVTNINITSRPLCYKVVNGHTPMHCKAITRTHSALLWCAPSLKQWAPLDQWFLIS